MFSFYRAQRTATVSCQSDPVRITCARLDLQYNTLATAALPPFSTANIDAESVCVCYFSRASARSVPRNRCESLRYTLTTSYAHNVSMLVPAAQRIRCAQCTGRHANCGEMRSVRRAPPERQSFQRRVFGHVGFWCARSPQTALVPAHSSINPEHRLRACAHNVWCE